jgi:hypothetical protein
MAMDRALRFVSMGLHDETPFKLVFQVTGHSEVMQAKFEVERTNSFFDIAYSGVLR